MNYFVEKIFATLALVAGIVSEANHTFIEKLPWSGFTLFANGASFILIPMWILAIVGLWSQDRLYKYFQLLGISFLGVHGLILSMGGNKSAVLFYFSMFVLSAVSSLFIEWRDRHASGYA
jgi:hypothetical protein